jgi:riboflavin kinase/FMN adenylyltransferase
MMRFTGIVQNGKKRGAKLGFPTANIPLNDGTLSGIYTGKVHVDGLAYLAALYADTSRKLLEAHLLDFVGDLYEKEIVVEIGDKIREARRFKDDAEARETIADDIARVREYGAKHE